MPRTLATQRQLVRDFGSCIDTGAFAGSIATSGSVNLSGPTFTLSAWVNVKNFQTGSPFISSICGEEDNTDVNCALLRMGNGSAATNNKINFTMKLSGTQPDFYSNTALKRGVWYHVVGVYDGVNMIIYINGISDATSPQTGSVVANTTFGASRSNGSATRQMSGLIDDIRAYTRALTPTEVLNLYNGVEPATTNLQLWWKLDEGSGTSATDSSGNSRTGTITSGTYSTNVFIIPRTVAGQRQTVRDFGTCLLFGVNASTNKASFAAPTTLNPANIPAFSYGCWFNPYSVSNNSAPKLFSNDGSADKGFALQLQSTNSFTAQIFSSGNAGQVTSSTGVITLNQWQRVIVTWSDANTLPKIYLNSVLLGNSATQAITGTRQIWDGLTVNIGNAAALNRVLLGLMDEYCIWNTELTQAQITQDYYNGVYTPNLLVRYKMDEGSGTTLVDATGNGITGTISGATYSTNVFIKARTLVS